METWVKVFIVIAILGLILVTLNLGEVFTQSKSSQPVRVVVVSADGNEPGHTDYVVVDRWNCKQAVFSDDKSDGTLDHVLLKYDRSQFTIYPQKAEILIVSDNYFSSRGFNTNLDWRRLENHFKDLKKEAVAQPPPG